MYKSTILFFLILFYAVYAPVCWALPAQLLPFGELTLSATSVASTIMNTCYINQECFHKSAITTPKPVLSLEYVTPGVIPYPTAVSMNQNTQDLFEGQIADSDAERVDAKLQSTSHLEG